MHKNLSDEELNSIIEAERRKGKKGCFVVYTAIIIFLVCMYFGDELIKYVHPEQLENIMIIGCGLIAFWGLCIHSKAKKNIKDKVGKQIVFSALNDVFREVVYLPDRHLEKTVIEQANMNFPFTYTSVSGSDYVEGIYKDVTILLSDIRLISRTKNRKEESITTNFEGLWLVCDFNKKISTELRLSERTTLFRAGIRTDNEQFNKQFYVESESPHEAFYILTPHMMEYIQNMDAQAHAHTYMCFLREGKVHIAINSRKNAFEVNYLKEDVSVLRERFRKEVKYITDIIDELKLVDTFFDENVKKDVYLLQNDEKSNIP